MTLDIKKAYEEFEWLKAHQATRNRTYYLNRQAVKGNFRWPADWPSHIDKEVENWCKPIVQRHTQFLMGKGFTWNIERPNTLEMREAAERAEKILQKIERKSKAKLQFIDAAKNGSMLGRSIFKVFITGPKGRQLAAFASVLPDYVYGVSAGGENSGEFSTLYYSYPLDLLEAKRIYGDHDYKTLATVDTASRYYEPIPEQRVEKDPRERTVPVVEIWTKDDYAIIVGEKIVAKGENPFRWDDTGEGFIPFVVIDNIRNAGEASGEADIEQSRIANEKLNWLAARKSHNVGRFLVPTLVWEGAPTNYSETLQKVLKGGGAIPVRLGARLQFLSHDRPNPMVAEKQAELRKSIVQVSGLNEVVIDGAPTGSINTGPSLQAQFQPALGTVEEKRMAWDVGIAELYAMLLQTQERIGDSKALGQAVINRRPDATSNMMAAPEGEASAEFNDGGMLVTLSGKDIRGLRDVSVYWPGVLPKDDLEASRFEIEKTSQGFQSIYTTLEHLGVDQPGDELARIRMENQDPHLRGEKVAEQARAMAPFETARMRSETDLTKAAMQQMSAPGAEGAPVEELEPLGSPAEATGVPDIRERFRQLQAASIPEMDLEGDEPVVTTGMV